ncbi:MAG TPA: exodeoxyribonuclease VII small subunit [Candidatus Hydrogenedens sp.]|nr:exodeoxyribonuclease VII small subunit [Candidatus Hydrogenedens sp.]
MKDKQDKPNPSNFEKDLEKLEKIVQELEKGDLTLEESLKQFEEGIRLARQCEKALVEAEKRIEILLQNESGEIEAQPFKISETENGAENNSSSAPQKTIPGKTAQSKPKKTITEEDNKDTLTDINEDLPF